MNSIVPHPSIHACTVTAFGADTETWNAFHGVQDDRGRDVGGRVEIFHSSGLICVRIQATRDGVTFGASRRASTHTSMDKARAAAEAKLLLQRTHFKHKFDRSRT